MLRKYTWRTRLLEGLGGLLALSVLFPAYLLAINAVRPLHDAGSRIVPPDDPAWSNFAVAWEEGGLAAATLNSLVVTVTSVVLVVGISSIAAYPLARITRTWPRVAYAVFMLGVLLPFQLFLIPLYVTLRDFGLLGSPASLVILYAGLQSPLAIFLYVEFLRQVPITYDEAAQVDGAGRWRTFVSVIFPLLRPITGTVIILNVVHIWNDFYPPLLYLSGAPFETLPLTIFQFTGEYSANWGLIFSTLIIGSAPILIAFVIMQRYVYQGYASGIKG